MNPAVPLLAFWFLFVSGLCWNESRRTASDD